jgi:sugar lactone lactonase YvrE
MFLSNNERRFADLSIFSFPCLRMLLLYACLSLLFSSIAGEVFMRVIAGTGTSGISSGDEGPATLANVARPYGIHADTVGNVYFADYSNNRIHHIDTNGIIHAIVGTGSITFTGSDGPGTSTNIRGPFGVIGDTSGQFLYIADVSHIWKYSLSSQNVQIYAGNSSQASTGDDGPSSSANVDRPYFMWLTTDDTMYFGSDSFTIRKITSDGIISRFAGSGTNGFGGDGGPALSTVARMKSPYGIYIDTNGKLYFCDYLNQRLRYVNTAGKLGTYAGGGSSSGEGIPATTAAIGQPTDIRADRDGNLYFMDSSFKIRKIDLFGKLFTFLGNGIQGLVIPVSTSKDSMKLSLALCWDNENDVFYYTESFGAVVKKSGNVSSPSSQPSSQPSTLGQHTPIPTFIPTKVPSFIPTTTSSLSPTMSLPSLNPSSASILSSVMPALSSSPSYSSSSSPHVEEEVEIEGALIISSVFADFLNNHSLITLNKAIYNISDHAESCEITSGALVEQSKRRRSLMTHTLTVVTYMFEISFHCSYSMSDYPSHNASNIETMKKTEIQHKVEDKIFQKVLRSFALYYNATQLFNSTCNAVTFLSYSTSSFTESTHDSSYSGSEIAAIVLGVIFGIYLCCFLMFCCFRRSRYFSKIAISIDDNDRNQKYNSSF